MVRDPTTFPRFHVTLRSMPFALNAHRGSLPVRDELAADAVRRQNAPAVDAAESALVPSVPLFDHLMVQLPDLSADEGK